MILKELEDWSVAEVAEHLLVSEGTVKSRLHRGRKELAGHLASLDRV